MKDIFRVLDANLNRAREGLRVVEEVTRFIWNDGTLSMAVKDARHDLQKATSFIPGGVRGLVAGRDAVGDVGARGIIESEMTRISLDDLVIANLTRAQEAARALEEFSKFVSPEASKHFKSFRFVVYDLEQEIIANRIKKSLLDFHLYVIVGDDPTLKGRDVVRLASDAIEGGAEAIQLRIKEGATADILSIGHRLRSLTTSEGVTFIVNDRPDIALAVNADGVHLGQDDLPVKVARDILGADKIIGLSTHSVTQAIAAKRTGADYIGVGPVFGTRTKPEAGRPVGIDLLRDVSRQVELPIVAIGGINAGNVENIIGAGVTRCAVISAVTSARNVVFATQKMKSAMEHN